MKTLICSNKIAKIEYNTRSKIIHANCRGIVDYNFVEEVISSIHQVVTRNGISGIIVNRSQLRGSFHRKIDYMKNEGFPLLIKHGLRVHAQIISDDLIIHNLSTKVMNFSKELGIDSKIFNDSNKAEEWVNWVLEEKQFHHS